MKVSNTMSDLLQPMLLQPPSSPSSQQMLFCGIYTTNFVSVRQQAVVEIGQTSCNALLGKKWVM